MIPKRDRWIGPVQPEPGAEPVMTDDGRFAPSTFTADFSGLGTLRVHVGQDRRPYVVGLTIDPSSVQNYVELDEWGVPPHPEEVTQKTIRSINLAKLLAQAVEMAHTATMERFTATFAPPPPAPRDHSRKRLTDDQVRDFVDRYRAAVGATVEERARAVGVGRSHVYRMRDEARDRHIIGEGEEL